MLVVHGWKMALYILYIVNRSHRTPPNVGWTFQNTSTESSGRVREMLDVCPREKASTESFGRVREMLDVCPRERCEKASTESFGRVRKMTSTPRERGARKRRRNHPDVSERDEMNAVREVRESVDGIIWTCERDDLHTPERGARKRRRNHLDAIREIIFSPYLHPTQCALNFNMWHLLPCVNSILRRSRSMDV